MSDDREPPPLPSEFTVETISARFVDLRWAPSSVDSAALKSYNDLINDEKNAFCSLYDIVNNNGQYDSAPLLSKEVIYRIIRLNERGNFEKVYEGKACNCRVQNLAPRSTYKFKLRVKWEDADEEAWSSGFVTCEAATVNEDDILFAFERLIKAVRVNNIANVVEILRKYRHDIKIDSPDKEGRTLTMVRSWVFFSVKF